MKVNKWYMPSSIEEERRFKAGIEEHEKCFLNNKQNSTYAKHVIDTGHNFNKDFQILNIENRSNKLSLLEE